MNGIYDAVAQSAQKRGWEGVDLLIICGDFQAVRNVHDLNAMSVPPKYRELGDFHEYYSGKRKAPYLTIFIGGNHEASSYLFELYYGGWVAPNIYYMGAANLLRLGGLRIAALSGIWKAFDFNKPHYERVPYSASDIRSLYHVREVDLRKLLQVRTQVDVGLSHDWPRKVEYSGNYKQLFRFKPHFEADSKSGQLGSAAAEHALRRLKPPHWFSGHMHCKFVAAINHQKQDAPEPPQQPQELPQELPTNDEVNTKNPDEIDLDVDMADDVAHSSSQIVAEASSANAGSIQSSAVEETVSPVESEQTSQVSESLRAQLPAAFSRPAKPQHGQNYRNISSLLSCQQTYLPEIKNMTTNFLALDKVIPGRSFLEMMEIPTKQPLQRPLKLEYDAEWLAITRAMAEELQLSSDASPNPTLPPDLGQDAYLPRIEREEAWVQEHIVAKNLLGVPENFVAVAPPHDEGQDIKAAEQPREYPNPQTQQFCDLIGIDNRLAMSESEISSRMANAPPIPTYQGSWGGGRGRGHGRGRGGWGRGNRGGYRVNKR